MEIKTREYGNQRIPYDSTEFSQRPSSLDAAYEREAILCGLVKRTSACFPENRPEQPASTPEALQHGEVRGDRRDRGLGAWVQPW